MAGIVYPDVVLPEMQVGGEYGYMLPVPGTGTAPFTWTVRAGYTLPAGLSVATNGYISAGSGGGTPAGTHNLRLKVTDAAGLSDDDVTATLPVLNWTFAYRLIGPGFTTQAENWGGAGGQAGPYLVGDTFYVIATEPGAVKLVCLWSTDQYVTWTKVAGPSYQTVSESGSTYHRGNYDSCLAGTNIWVIHTDSAGHPAVSVFDTVTKTWGSTWSNTSYNYYFVFAPSPVSTSRYDMKQIVPLSDGSFCLLFGNTDPDPLVSGGPQPRAFVQWLYFYPEETGGAVWGDTGWHSRPVESGDTLPENYAVIGAWAGADDRVYFGIKTIYGKVVEYTWLYYLDRDGSGNGTLTESIDLAAEVGGGTETYSNTGFGNGAVMNSPKMALALWTSGYASGLTERLHLAWGDAFPSPAAYTQFINPVAETSTYQPYPWQSEAFGDGTGMMYWQSNRVRLIGEDGSAGIQLIPYPYDGLAPLDIISGLSAYPAGENVASVWPRAGSGVINLWFGIWTRGAEPDDGCPIPNYAF